MSQNGLAAAIFRLAGNKPVKPAPAARSIGFGNIQACGQQAHKFAIKLTKHFSITL